MKPQPPPPSFVGERARLEEHERMMAQARRFYGCRVICPDCYKPPAQCEHLERNRK